MSSSSNSRIPYTEEEIEKNMLDMLKIGKYPSHDDIQWTRAHKRYRNLLQSDSKTAKHLLRKSEKIHRKKIENKNRVRSIIKNKKKMSEKNNNSQSPSSASGEKELLFSDDSETMKIGGKLRKTLRKIKL